MEYLTISPPVTFDTDKNMTDASQNPSFIQPLYKGRGNLKRGSLGRTIKGQEVLRVVKTLFVLFWNLE